MQHGGCQHLVGTGGTRQFSADDLLDLRDIAPVEQADILLDQGDVASADDAVAPERRFHHDHRAEDAHLGRHEHGPGRTALAADAHGDATNRLCRAFQALRQITVAGGEAQARVERVDLDFMARRDFATLQIVLYHEFKKAFGGADKLFG